MNIINLSEWRVVQLWKGRRLLLENRETGRSQLVKLPGGSARRTRESRRSHIAFGSLRSVGCQVDGSHSQIDDLWAALVALEQPNTSDMKAIT